MKDVSTMIAMLYQQELSCQWVLNMLCCLLTRFSTRTRLISFQKLFKEWKTNLVLKFNFTFRYIYRRCFVIHMYAHMIEIKDTTGSVYFAAHLDMQLKFDNTEKLPTKLYARRDDFNFSIVNFNFLSSLWSVCLNFWNILKPVRVNANS